MAGIETLTEWITLAAREFGFWGGVVLLVVSAIATYQGWQQRKLYQLAMDTPLSDIGDITDPSRARVRGEITAQAPRDPFTAPVSGDEDTVLEAWEIKETYDTPKDERTEKAAWGVTAVPFYVTDGTGQLLVDIDDVVMGEHGSSDREFVSPEALHAVNGVACNGVHCEFETFDTQVETGYDDSPPARIADFIRRTNGLSSDPMVTDIGESVVEDSKRTYRGQTLQVGDEVSLIGYVEPQHGTTAGQEFALRHDGTADNWLYLSEQEFRNRATGTGLFVFAGLAVCFAVALIVASLTL